MFSRVLLTVRHQDCEVSSFILSCLTEKINGMPHRRDKYNKKSALLMWIEEVHLSQSGIIFLCSVPWNSLCQKKTFYLFVQIKCRHLSEPEECVLPITHGSKAASTTVFLPCTLQTPSTCYKEVPACIWDSPVWENPNAYRSHFHRQLSHLCWGCLNPTLPTMCHPNPCFPLH